MLDLKASLGSTKKIQQEERREEAGVGGWGRLSRLASAASPASMGPALPVQVESGDLRVVSLKVDEIEEVLRRLFVSLLSEWKRGVRPWTQTSGGSLVAELIHKTSGKEDARLCSQSSHREGPHVERPEAPLPVGPAGGRSRAACPTLTILQPPAPCALHTRPPTQAALMTVADSLKSPVFESE